MIRLYLYARVVALSKRITHNFIDRLRLFSMGKCSSLALEKVCWGNNFHLNFSSNHERNNFKHAVQDQCPL